MNKPLSSLSILRISYSIIGGLAGSVEDYQNNARNLSSSELGQVISNLEKALPSITSEDVLIIR
ncbi:hypothetical protein F7734_58210 [Scytonema sp. UIC 10036]|uniref:hypothetical protein n=1 Tax=Scytonema sp. UIC 10036 TaxID=2304196 RepID=UPI0012DA886F|nr:hypothetical protein [Scytonema sp. UIC 10036]MUH01492.1 hypothetical protein [Scytonema sp. UIC 10036]